MCNAFACRCSRPAPQRTGSPRRPGRSYCSSRRGDFRRLRKLFNMGRSYTACCAYCGRCPAMCMWCGCRTWGQAPSTRRRPCQVCQVSSRDCRPTLLRDGTVSASAVSCVFLDSRSATPEVNADYRYPLKGESLQQRNCMLRAWACQLPQIGFASKVAMITERKQNPFKMSEKSETRSFISPRANGFCEKALQVNLDNTIYGSFAEIGAGQEVRSRRRLGFRLPQTATEQPE